MASRESGVLERLRPGRHPVVAARRIRHGAGVVLFGTTMVVLAGVAAMGMTPTTEPLLGRVIRAALAQHPSGAGQWLVATGVVGSAAALWIAGVTLLVEGYME